jgi:CubicO group peptidase (beta-lactamase class C family)
VTFRGARQLILDAVDMGATPAAAIDVGRAGERLWSDAFGRLSYDLTSPSATADTIFDLASLTKVIATTSLVMQAIDAGRLALDQPVGEVLADWRDEAHKGVRVRHLLDHSSGLPARVRLWESASGRTEYAAALCAVPLEAPPGTRSVYSDLGFLALGFLLEALHGQTLDRQFDELQRRTWRGALAFGPVEAADRTAPTEFDQQLGRAIAGDVHDENARAVGGVAGHAGLFGTAGDVGAFARMVLRSFQQPTPLATPALMRHFATETGVAGSSRALGWDVMRPTSSCGRLLSPTAIGHTGFTGTSLWIDPERDLYVAFLTNRIHPTRANERLLPMRPQLHEAIVRELA